MQPGTIPVDLKAIRAAQLRIAPHIHRTPVMTSVTLNVMAGAQLYFKCENLQKTGSFKIRGATNAIFSLDKQEAARGVVTHSSGNHAAAVARAARQLGTEAWIVMPANTPAAKQRAVENYGGQISYSETPLASREAVAREVLRKTGGVLIHPFDNDLVIAGQGTAALELLEEVPDLDYLMAPVSGGGLLSGTALSGKSLKPRIKIVGCEPKNADDAYRSFVSGTLQSMENPRTIADGLRASLAPRTFAIISRLVDQITLVSEEEIVEAMRHIWERMKIIIEPSAAVAVAPALGRTLGTEGKKVGIILSGGNVDLSSLPFAARIQD